MERVAQQSAHRLRHEAASPVPPRKLIAQRRLSSTLIPSEQAACANDCLRFRLECDSPPKTVCTGEQLTEAENKRSRFLDRLERLAVIELHYLWIGQETEYVPSVCNGHFPEDEALSFERWEGHLREA
jgi:hypothetical protein